MLKLRYVIFSAAVFIGFHAACHFFNLYFEVWWTDIAAHFIAGFTAGLFMWWLFDARSNMKGTSSKTIALSILSFSTFISVLWEFWEFSNWKFAFLRDTIGKIQQQYYPYLENNLGDILWGLLGGLACAIIYLLVKRRYKKQ